MLQRRGQPATGPDTLARSFEQALGQHFQGALLEADYVVETADLLAGLGFTRDNSLACVAACRDEIASPLLADVEQRWGQPFSFVSLAGLLTAGRTGFGAALHHAPIEGGRRRMVCYAMPHIAISAEGAIGEVQRPGVPTPSHACGALHALHHDLSNEGIEPGFDPLDVEQSLLATRLMPAIGNGPVPDLVDLVRLAAQAIEDDLWELFRHVVGDQPADPLVDGALFTGIQIHGPGATNHVWPRSGHVLVDGTMHIIDRSPAPDPAPRDVRPRRARRWLARGAAATAAAVLLNARQAPDRP